MMIKLTLRSWLVYLPCKQANKMILRARHKRHCWQMIAAMQAAKGFDQKQDGKANDAGIGKE